MTEIPDSLHSSRPASFTRGGARVNWLKSGQPPTPPSSTKMICALREIKLTWVTIIMSGFRLSYSIILKDC